MKYFAFIFDQVILYGNWKEHIDKMNLNGCLINTNNNINELWNSLLLNNNINNNIIKKLNDNLFNVKIKGEYNKNKIINNQLADKILFFEKSYNTEIIGKNIKDFLKPNGSILTLQNGGGNLETLQNIFGNNRVLYGITSYGCNVKQIGEINHNGTGLLSLISPKIELYNKCKEWYNIFNIFDKNIKMKFEEKPKTLWKKLIVNCAINSLTSIYNIKNGELLNNNNLIDKMLKISKECLLVMKYEGINLNDDEEKEYLNQPFIVAKQTSNNYSSMLCDIKNKRKTENDNILGYVIKKSKINNLNIPTCEEIYNKVKELDKLSF